MSPLLPYSFARQNGVLVTIAEDGSPLSLHRKGVSLSALMEAQRLCELPLTFAATDDAAFEQALAETYRSNALQAADAAASSETDLASLADSAAQVDDILDERNDAPVVRLINALLSEAIREKASDIHIEPHEQRLAIRFRVDGVLRDRLEPKRSLAPMLVGRIKVMAGLDIAEKRKPHDGRVSLRVGGHDVDVRVSTIPSQYGERVVLRLLDRSSAGFELSALGMSETDFKRVTRLLEKPSGMILVTGPTGSGKTTTLYAAITRLNDRERNIMTVEDPVEYALDGIGQMQVNPQKGVTFASGVRALMRQDPNVILIGEIRDSDTASAALRAATSGHLVLSTLHTTSAIGSVTRLVDMGVERYLLAPTLAGLIAQRLVRTLCAACSRESVLSEFDAARLSGLLPVGTPVREPVGCEACLGQGYRGRTALYEIVEVDDTLEAMIHDGRPESELIARARTVSPSLMEDGAMRIRDGLTSVDEVVAVADSL